MTWNPFKKSTDEQPAGQDEPAASMESGAKTTEGKGHPTPKRKEAQARNLRPLVPGGEACAGGRSERDVLWQL